MRIGLIDIDGKWPNLALMKISAYHKSKGDDVVLDRTRADIVYISCIFSRNKSKALGIARLFRSFGSEVHIGGSGVDLKKCLPECIENIQPDFSLYGLDYSLGFSSRGCIRTKEECPACIVPEKEGNIRELGLSWIRHNRVKFLDNNFLASPAATEKLKFIAKGRLEVCFTQGLDIRLVTRVTDMLSKVNARSNNWKRRRYYFAFDHPELEEVIIKKIDLLKRHGIPASAQFFYVLCGFDTTHLQDRRRVQILADRGCLPFVMKYQRRDKTLNLFANWVNGRFYRFCKFEKFSWATEWAIRKKKKARGESGA